MLNLKFGDLGSSGRDLNESSSTIQENSDSRFTSVDNPIVSAPIGRVQTPTIPQISNKSRLSDTNTKPNKPAKPQIKKAIAIYDYSAQQDGDLSFKKGELVWVISEEQDGWWEGTAHGIKGTFPGTYVEYFS